MADETDSRTCQWTNQARALRTFGEFTGKTQSASHIKALHWYIACRLVIEGGFDPDDITPRPPFRIERKPGRAPILHLDAALAGGGERTVLGGLKTKNVDVVVTLDGIGPVLAISCKGVTKAFRNLTNRLEETIGECTNLHITYPALVLGYFVLLRANRQSERALEHSERVASGDGEEDPAMALAANDIAMTEGGEPVSTIIRFHNALRELAGRRGIRNDVSRYEAIGFGLVEMVGLSKSSLVTAFPGDESPLHLHRFFDTLYLRYDERFVISAPDLARKTRRAEWDAESPVTKLIDLDYPMRIAG